MAIAPANLPIPQAHSTVGPSLDAGSFRGSTKNYLPTRVLGPAQRAFERNLGMARVDDLYLNDGVAKSGVNSIATNVIGTGLRPQSVIAHDMLGIERAVAIKLQDQMEWLWFEWCGQAHYREQLHFDDLQMLGLRSLIRAGEFVHMPVREMRPGCRFSLRLQDIKPSRLRTPFDRQYDPYIHDGVEVSASGLPLAYWIASPPPSTMIMDDAFCSSSQFRRIPARIGHLRGLFHIFRAGGEEEFRGVSCLAPAVKFFRHLNDSIDYELMAQVVAASFPVFITQEQDSQMLPAGVRPDDYEGYEAEDKKYYQYVEAGTMMYGNKGEKPEVLESKRPYKTFIEFCNLVLRITAASLEIPYEVLTKDFSKTTYSSARAALLEAWRVYDVYRTFFVRHYCQNVWQMVLEEAWLRGYLTLPENAPDFYAGLPYWCNARWIGPARGYIDPEKETNAAILSLNSGLVSRTQVIAERGGDFEEVAVQLAHENDRFRQLGLCFSEAPAGATGPVPAGREASENIELRAEQQRQERRHRLAGAIMEAKSASAQAH